MQPHTSPIPDAWKASVIPILRRERGLRDLTRRARQDWAKLDDSHTVAQLYELLADVLEEGTYHQSAPVCGMEPPGEVYEFCFEHQPPRFSSPIPLYAKINLREGKLAVIVVSTHP
jgi:hypothetical protein